MPVKLIIFDLDGTLVDTAQDIAAALNHAIHRYGLGPIKVEEVKALIGEGTSRLIEKAIAPLGRKADERTFKAALKAFLDHYTKHLSTHSRLYPSVNEALWKLTVFEKAVISNKREALSRRLLQDLRVAGEFSIVVGSDTTVAKKPSPEPVLYVLEHTGTSPEEALMVGDSPYDIEAAKNAGVRAVAVTYGYRERRLLKDADFIIDDLMELPPLLLKIKAIDEKRHEPRRVVAPVCRKYISISVKSGEGFAPAVMLDLSEGGLMFKSPVRFEPGSPFECEVSIPQSLNRTVGISGTVRHSLHYEREFYTGVKIESVSSKLWLRVFRKVCDFMAQRRGSFY